MRRIAMTLALAATPVALAAQLGLPGVPAIGSAVGDVTDRLPVDAVTRLRPAELARTLLQDRTERLRALLRTNRESIELDDRGDPAVRGVLIASGMDEAGLARAQAAGFTLIGRERIEGLGLSYATLRAPRGRDLSAALKALRELAPGAEISADTLHFPSGAALPAVTAGAAAASGASRGTIGLIDGGVAAHPAIGAVQQQGFARGAPSPSPHGTAVASLLVGQGSIRGAASGARLLAADVYGRDPAGGNATAIARALGWLLSRGVPVVTISLVGPANPLLARAVSIAQGRGMMIVAAVGNDGPAAPPAYPASYPGVIAVTGVDGGNRALVEAGRSLHLDYAAPGADMRAASADGRTVKVRGTSYAAPLVAGRLLAVYPALSPQRRAGALRALDGQARDLGPKGADGRFGRGLLCGDCRTR